MVKLYKYLFYLFFYIFLNNFCYAQYEFYNDGAIVKLSSGSASSTPTLFVNGSITNLDGEFTNSGSFLELKGNITNTPTSYHYASTGIERFSGTAAQTIFGTWNGTSSNLDQFYTLKVYKTSSTGENIILDNSVTANSVNINPSGTLVFESSNGIIRTQSTSSTSPYTGNYTNTLYLQNSSTTAITGHSTTSGATTKYIEGKLRRQVSNTGTYFFPIGVEKSGLDGMEAFSVTLNSLSMPSGSSTGLLGYIQPATNPSYTSDLTTNGDILFFDIGYFTSPALNNFSQCSGGPDGKDDVAVIDQAITHEWILSPNNAPTTIDYNITMLPGNTLESQINYSTMGTPCSGLYSKAQYLARNGIIGGNGAVGPTINYWVPGVTGYYQKPTLKTLANQNGFSRFRIFGASDNNTSLPVELTKFTLTPINNEYFNLNWETASEFNNAGFYIQRNTDITPFEDIGWVVGNGTTTSLHEYNFADHDVLPNTLYYYRLKQVDANQTFKYSNTLSGILKSSTDFNIFTISPNPTVSNIQANIYAPENGAMEINIYDILGQNLKSNFTLLNKGNNIININLADLESAMYIIKFKYNNTIITKKIIKD